MATEVAAHHCLHPDFASLSIAGPEPFPVNPRLTPDTSLS